MREHDRVILNLVAVEKYSSTSGGDVDLRSDDRAQQQWRESH